MSARDGLRREPSRPTARLADYERLRRAVADEPLPAAVIDLAAFDRNLAWLIERVAGTGKTIRLATKSVRAPALLRRALERGGDALAGLLCYSAREAAFLHGQGFDDLLVAYPSVQRADLDALAAIAGAGGRASIVVDGPAHLDALAAAAAAHRVTLACVVELDVAYRPLGGRLHLGVRRSPLRTPEAVVALAEAVRARPGLALAGLMAYEAHVAGLTDANPFTRALNPAKRWLKARAMPRAAALRAATVEALRARGLAPAIVNAGGTGSLALAAREPAVTEVTAGSGLFAPHLFDYYRALDLEPAALFAVPVARVSDPGFVTCHGGGWVASGEAGPDRLPLPWLPPGLALLGPEGAGEVQTPLDARRSPVALALGDPVFFRHAKAGELCEHVPSLRLVEGDRVVGRAETYRGLGQAFL